MYFNSDILGKNIIVIDLTENMQILCPPTEDIRNFYRFDIENRSNIILLKTNNIYETLVHVSRDPESSGESTPSSETEYNITEKNIS